MIHIREHILQTKAGCDCLINGSDSGYIIMDRIYFRGETGFLKQQRQNSYNMNPYSFN